MCDPADDSSDLTRAASAGRAPRRSRAGPPGRLDGRAGIDGTRNLPTRPHDSHNDRPVRRGRRGAGPGGASLRVDRPGSDGRPARDAFAELAGAKHAVAVNNGTTALIAALQVLDLQPGDEVITTPFTFVATLNAILEAGATARFADIREDDFNVDPAAVCERGHRPRPRCSCRCTSTARRPTWSRWSRSPRRTGSRIVEDAAQAHGATYDGRGAGSFGLGCFSFYATKNMTTGEGGMITTDDDALADRLRLLRNQGMRARYQYEMAGNNYRLTDLQAALGIPQLARYDETVARRRSNAARLADGLERRARRRRAASCPGAGTCGTSTPSGSRRMPPSTATTSSSSSGERGVGSGVYYPRLVFDYDATARIRACASATSRSPSGSVAVPVAAGAPGADRRRPRPRHRRRARRGRSLRWPREAHRPRRRRLDGRRTTPA